MPEQRRRDPAYAEAPGEGKGADDDVYRLGQAGFARDRRLYQRRVRLWT